MRGRGNYSWSFPKKGFNLKFPKLGNEDKYDLCGMGKSRKWALIANDYDRSLLRNSAANFVGKQMGNLDYTPKEVAVDLYVNGSYRGAYILIERVNFEGGRLDEEELKSDDDTAAVLLQPEPSGPERQLPDGVGLPQGRVLQLHGRKPRLGRPQGARGRGLLRQHGQVDQRVCRHRRSGSVRRQRQRQRLDVEHRPGLRRRLLHRDGVPEAGGRPDVGQCLHVQAPRRKDPLRAAVGLRPRDGFGYLAPAMWRARRAGTCATR